jgi:hypothetical protein
MRGVSAPKTGLRSLAYSPNRGYRQTGCYFGVVEPPKVLSCLSTTSTTSPPATTFGHLNLPRSVVNQKLNCGIYGFTLIQRNFPDDLLTGLDWFARKRKIFCHWFSYYNFGKMRNSGEDLSWETLYGKMKRARLRPAEFGGRRVRLLWQKTMPQEPSPRVQHEPTHQLRK